MPLGTPVAGSAATVFVGTTSGAVTTPVGGLSTWTINGNTPTQQHDYYGQSSFFSVGKTARTIDFSNDYETADSGHAIIYAAFISKATIFVKILADGTNGETLPVKVGNQVITGDDVNNHTKVSWTFAQQGDPTTVGTGFGT